VSETNPACFLNFEKKSQVNFALVPDISIHLFGTTWVKLYPRFHSVLERSSINITLPDWFWNDPLEGVYEKQKKSASGLRDKKVWEPLLQILTTLSS
jgi:hypothetical protein